MATATLSATAARKAAKPQALVQLEEQAAQATRLMKLVANEQRLLLLCKLTEGECPVGDLANMRAWVCRLRLST